MVVESGSGFAVVCHASVLPECWLPDIKILSYCSLVLKNNITMNVRHSWGCSKKRKKMSTETVHGADTHVVTRYGVIPAEEALGGQLPLQGACNHRRSPTITATDSDNDSDAGVPHDQPLCIPGDTSQASFQDGIPGQSESPPQLHSPSEGVPDSVECTKEEQKDWRHSPRRLEQGTYVHQTPFARR